MEIGPDPDKGEVSRDDVAAVLGAVLHEPRTARRILYVRSGERPVEQGLEAFLAGAGS